MAPRGVAAAREAGRECRLGPAGVPGLFAIAPGRTHRRPGPDPLPGMLGPMEPERAEARPRRGSEPAHNNSRGSALDSGVASPQQPLANTTRNERTIQTDVLILGGGTGGVAAALAATAGRANCVMTEPTDWVGGQLTSQAVPPDENRWIEDFGGTRRYQEFRTRVRDWYREHRGLTAAARAQPNLNPGHGWVSRLCFEPRIGHDVLEDMLAKTGGRLRTMLRTDLVSVEMERPDRIGAVTVRSLETGQETTIHAKYVLDATELGDLYPLANVEHRIGAEGRNETGELHARADGPDPMDQQAFSWCFALEHRPGENHVISRPAGYDVWRDHIPKMDPPWCGPLFSWTVPSHNEAGCRTFPFLPWPDACPTGVWDMWRYRRIVDHSIYEPHAAAAHPDVCLVNWVQMDYWMKPLLGVDAATQQDAYREAKELSRCLVYWMQTEAPRLDASGNGGSGVGFPGLRLRGDELGTTDGFAKAAYIREPRRLEAKVMVTEGHIGIDQRLAQGHAKRDGVPDAGILAELFEDSVGIGHYTLDLHPSTSGRNSVYVPAAPFRIPLGSLLPVRVSNLIAAGKGIGVTHVTNGCYRMHHTEWNIGESAGALAAWCIAKRLEPAAVWENPTQRQEFQEAIVRDGVRIDWPWERA